MESLKLTSGYWTHFDKMGVPLSLDGGYKKTKQAENAHLAEHCELIASLSLSGPSNQPHRHKEN